jgi:hypothetical protein
VGDVALEAIKPDPADTQPHVPEPLPGRGQVVTWAHGIVRDEAGEPVKGAAVYALATYHGGIRMLEQIAHGATDGAGLYELKGEGGLSAFSAVVVAHAAGRPPAVAWIRSADESQALVPIASTRALTRPAAMPRATDLVLPARGGSLEVAVVRPDGGAFAGARVAARRRELRLRDIWAGPVDGDARDRLQDILLPTATAGPDGVARFEHLIPGAYDVVAIAPPVAAAAAAAAAGAAEADNNDGDDDRADPRRAWDRFSPDPNEVLGDAEGVPVRAGETARFRLAIYRQPNAVKFRVLDGARARHAGERRVRLRRRPRRRRRTFNLASTCGRRPT